MMTALLPSIAMRTPGYLNVSWSFLPNMAFSSSGMDFWTARTPRGAALFQAIGSASLRTTLRASLPFSNRPPCSSQTMAPVGQRSIATREARPFLA